MWQLSRNESSSCWRCLLWILLIASLQLLYVDVLVAWFRSQGYQYLKTPTVGSLFGDLWHYGWGTLWEELVFRLPVAATFIFFTFFFQSRYLALPVTITCALASSLFFGLSHVGGLLPKLLNQGLGGFIYCLLLFKFGLWNVWSTRIIRRERQLSETILIFSQSNLFNAILIVWTIHYLFDMILVFRDWYL